MWNIVCCVVKKLSWMSSIRDCSIRSPMNGRHNLRKRRLMTSICYKHQSSIWNEYYRVTFTPKFVFDDIAEKRFDRDVYNPLTLIGQELYEEINIIESALYSCNYQRAGRTGT